jgi:hypothetical protein
MPSSLDQLKTYLDQSTVLPLAIRSAALTSLRAYRGEEVEQILIYYMMVGVFFDYFG